MKRLRGPSKRFMERCLTILVKVDPDYTREGGSIPITSCIEEATGMNVLLLPIGACDDMAHSQNEKYNISNLVNGIKVMTNETRSDRRKPSVISLICCSILLSLGFGSLLA